MEKMETIFPKYKVKSEYTTQLRKMIFEFLDEKNEDDGIVYRVINNNSEMTIEQIRYKLRREHEIHRRPSGIKKIADWCGLKYKEKE